MIYRLVPPIQCYNIIKTSVNIMFWVFNRALSKSVRRTLKKQVPEVTNDAQLSNYASKRMKAVHSPCMHKVSKLKLTKWLQASTRVSRLVNEC